MFPWMGVPVESLDKPVAERVLQAMAQAYPDPVDLSLLAMVMGCDESSGAISGVPAPFDASFLANSRNKPRTSHAAH